MSEERVEPLLEQNGDPLADLPGRRGTGRMFRANFLARHVSNNQKRVLKFVCPFITVLAVYVIFGAIQIFSAQVQIASANLVFAGYALQMLLLLILLREVAIALYECCCGRLINYQ